MLASSLAALLAVYATGVTRPWRRAGYGLGIRRVEAIAFAGGWLTLAVALSPPLDQWSDTWLVAHMVQHELLMAIAAPLMAVSAPLVALLWALPAGVRRPALAAIRRRPIAAVWTAISAPLS